VAAGRCQKLVPEWREGISIPFPCQLFSTGTPCQWHERGNACDRDILTAVEEMGLRFNMQEMSCMGTRMSCWLLYNKMGVRFYM
jgi:hypothetical protein